MPTSPASGDRRAAIDRALADDRAEHPHDTNRDAADVQVPPSHGDPPRSADTPNTSQDGRR
jgi:hypothetical protein